MRILITNDDGIEAPGLRTLHSLLETEHQVTVVAPIRDMSGTSQCITVGRPLDAHRRGDRLWAVDGTPADCVRLGVLALCGERPDLVVSGINLGPNLGDDIIYSGTAGAARQAVIMGLPAIAASAYAYESPEDARPCGAFVAAALSSLSDALALRALGRPAFININAPPRPDGRIAITRPSSMRYRTELEELEGTGNGDGEIRRFRPRSRLLPLAPDDTEDLLAVTDGAISLSAMSIWGVDTELEFRLRERMGAFRSAWTVHP